MRLAFHRHSDAAISCPGCGGTDLATGWNISAVPAMNTAVFKTVEAARGIPKGEIVLQHCRACGLVFNGAFSPWLVEYSQNYEETQHFSQRFCCFEEDLVMLLVEKCDLRNKMVLDIGCGKGEFLCRMCRAGDNRGIGIDPAVIPERIPLADRKRVQLQQRLYFPGEAIDAVDLVCLKMTLEHLAEPLHFLNGLRQTLNHSGCPLFIQVPNGQTVLESGAFWDVYHEHCNYFTESSLRTLLAHAGYALERIWSVFGNQYICLIAHPTGFAQESGLEGSASSGDSFEQFNRLASGKITFWKERVKRSHLEGTAVFLWGGGSKAVAFDSAMGEPGMIEGAIDINPHKQDTFLAGSGLKVHSPAILENCEKALIIVMNPNYSDEVRAMLASMGKQFSVAALD